MTKGNNVRVLEIIHKAKLQGINLVLDAGKLSIRKAKDTILPTGLMNEIKHYKFELIDFLEAKTSLSDAPSYMGIRNTEKADSYPISYGQKSIWLANQATDEDLAIYNIPSTFNLGKNLNLDCFRRAINTLVERHEILRTVFKINGNGEVRQYIIDPNDLNFALHYQDFRTDKDPKGMCKAVIAEDSKKPFDLAVGPLLRASLFRLSEEEYLFYYNVHHIISDLWSIGVIAHDLMLHYQAYVAGVKPNVPPLKIQYKDYTVWQLEQLNSPTYEAHKSYWTSKFKEEIPLIDLPTQKKRPEFKTNIGSSVGTWLSPELVTKLRQFIEQQGGSIFMGLLAVCKILIYRYTGEEDLTIGTMTAGRNHPDLENQIGFYVNPIALRSKIKWNENFVETYQRIKSNTLEAYKYQAYPFDLLIQDLKLAKVSNRSALFDIIIDYTDLATSKLDLERGHELQNCGEDETIKFDIEFRLAETSGGVDFIVGYNNDVYEEQMIKNLICHYRLLMKGLLDAPEKQIGSVDYFLPVEKNRILEGLNDTRYAYLSDKTVLEIFEERTKQWPERIGLTFGEQQLTYSELDLRAIELANFLIDFYEIQEEDLIGIKLERSEWEVISILAVWKTGAAYAPIDVLYPKERIETIERDADFKVIIDEFLLEIFMNSPKSQNPVVRPPGFSSRSLAYIIYTSGSTGQPKGVMIEHRSLWNYLNWCIEYYLQKNLQNFDFGLFTSPSFDLTLTSLWLPLLTGGKLEIFSSSLNTLETLEQYFQRDLSCIKLTPSHVELLSHSKIRNSKVELAIVGGEELKDVHIDTLRMLNPKIKIYNEYGPTEATIGSIVYEIKKDSPRSIIYIGKPIYNTEVYILNQRQQLVPFGAKGEIYIGGDGVARGYLNQEELTSIRFIDNPFKKGTSLYRTGDLGVWLPNGNIMYEGRVDFQIKIRGYRIELGEIEVVMNEIEGVEQAVTWFIEDKQDAKQLVAYVKVSKPVNRSDLKEQLDKRLPKYMVPKAIVFLDQIPLTTHGKIDHKSLPKPKEEDFNRQVFVAPTNRVEKDLASIWSALLSRKRISIYDNFYDLGGDSIKSIELIMQMETNGYQITVMDILNNPILKDLAKCIKSSDAFSLGSMNLVEGKEKQDNIQEKGADPKASLTEESKTLSQSVDSGEFIPISETQRYFIRRPWAFIPSPSILITNYNQETFELQLKAFIGLYPSLRTVFAKKDNHGIVQRILNIEAFKFDIRTFENTTPDDDKVKEFLHQPFDYFNQEPLVRISLQVNRKNPGEAIMHFCVAHALIDVDTFKQICQVFEDGFEGQSKQGIQTFRSNIDFANWQNQFLNSSVGLDERNWWILYLQKQSKRCEKFFHNQAQIEYVTQYILITGTDFQSLMESVSQLNLPITALFLAAQQQLLGEVFGWGPYLQLIAVNGKDQIYEGIDISKVAGATTNFLPMQVIDRKSMPLRDYALSVYDQYLNVRLHQKIPYEVIRSDFQKQHKVDIDGNIKGFFNFRQLGMDQNIEPVESNEVALGYQHLYWLDVYGLGLICDLYNNGISIRLLCSRALYDNPRFNLTLDAFVENKLLNPKWEA